MEEVLFEDYQSESADESRCLMLIGYQKIEGNFIIPYTCIFQIGIITIQRHRITEAYDYGGGDPATYASWWWTRTQHDARWLLDGSGNITIHNNNSTTDPSPPGLNAWSQFFEIVVPYAGGGYAYTPGIPFGPSAPTILAEYNPSKDLLNSVFAGGGQKLENDHVFTTSASKFWLVEHDKSGNIVWDFDLKNIHPAGGQVFKAQKYPLTYPGLSRLTMVPITPKKTILSIVVIVLISAIMIRRQPFLPY